MVRFVETASLFNTRTVSSQFRDAIDNWTVASERLNALLAKEDLSLVLQDTATQNSKTTDRHELECWLRLVTPEEMHASYKAFLENDQVKQHAPTVFECFSKALTQRTACKEAIAIYSALIGSLADICKANPRWLIRHLSTIFEGLARYEFNEASIDAWQSMIVFIKLTENPNAQSALASQAFKAIFSAKAMLSNDNLKRVAQEIFSLILTWGAAEQFRIWRHNGNLDSNNRQDGLPTEQVGLERNH